MDNLCHCIISLLNGSLNGTYSTKMLFQFLFGVAVRFIDRLGGFPKVVEVTELARDIWKGGMDGIADRVLTI